MDNLSSTTGNAVRKKTRADVFRDRIAIRLATNEAGPLIAEVIKENGIDLPGADWTKVFPHWLIATVDDEVIGCLMVLPAKPFGFIEFMYVKPSVSFKLRAIAVKKLCEQGAATLQVYGASYLFSAVDAKNRSFCDILKRFNVIDIGDAKVMLKRLR